MNPEIEVISIGASRLFENSWVFQELLFLGITTFTQSVIDENLEIFRSMLEKNSNQVFCIGGSDHFKEIAAEFPDKMILWLPDDLQKIKSKFYSRRMHFFLLLEDQLKEVIQTSSQVEVHVYSWEDKVSVVMTSASEESLEAEVLNLRSRFLSYEIQCQSGSVALALQETLIKQGKTVSFAESCTGGLLSHLMTSNAGCSNCFLGSFITYSNAFKQDTLGVKKETLIQYGAVSAQVVEEMLSGVLALSGADFSVAISGVAGPEGGTENTPVGTVWFAIGKKGELPEVGVLQIMGNRKRIISLTSYRILALLYRKVHYGLSIDNWSDPRYFKKI